MALCTIRLSAEFAPVANFPSSALPNDGVSTDGLYYENVIASMAGTLAVQKIIYLHITLPKATIPLHHNHWYLMYLSLADEILCRLLHS
jgi:hypothetical protein